MSGPSRRVAFDRLLEQFTQAQRCFHEGVDVECATGGDVRERLVDVAIVVGVGQRLREAAPREGVDPVVADCLYPRAPLVDGHGRALEVEAIFDKEDCSRSAFADLECSVAVAADVCRARAREVREEAFRQARCLEGDSCWRCFTL